MISREKLFVIIFGRGILFLEAMVRRGGKLMVIAMVPMDIDGLIARLLLVVGIAGRFVGSSSFRGEENLIRTVDQRHRRVVGQRRRREHRRQ
jgi:hypothetical protein